MDGFLSWFFAFMTNMLGGLWKMVSNFGLGIAQVFDIPYYIKQFESYSRTYTVIDWILSILAFILTFGIWIIILLLIIFGIRKYLRFRKTLVQNEDLLEEMADMHRDIIKLTKEREKLLELRLDNTGISAEEIERALMSVDQENGFGGSISSVGATEQYAAASEIAAGLENQGDGAVRAASADGIANSSKRFARLSAVDEKYKGYIKPEYNNSLSLEDLCETFRNFACSRMGLFYEIKTIRLIFAGLASTKLILLQGISGTGKTSLPYSMGKFFKNDATVASVQPSWRDRTELFGYFNEFTKKFSETEVLKRIYESSFNDDINIIILDEMNIARVEYYFAEMLSVLEMPDPSEWKLEIVPSPWPSDPEHLQEGKLTIPQNVWYIGTANNDDSTHSVSDKVYDRALVINLDSKGVPFDAPDTPPTQVSYEHVAQMYKEAIAANPVEEKYLDDIGKLDLYVIEKFRVAFGNRIMKQLRIFVPVYIACGGTELEGIDYILATKVFRKFESLNLSLIRDEIDGLMDYLDALFGVDSMKDCKEYLGRLKRMY